MKLSLMRTYFVPRTSNLFHFTEHSTIFRMVPKSYKFEVFFDYISHFFGVNLRRNNSEFPWGYLNFKKSYFCRLFSEKWRTCLKMFVTYYCT